MQIADYAAIAQIMQQYGIQYLKTAEIEIDMNKSAIRSGLDAIKPSDSAQLKIVASPRIPSFMRPTAPSKDSQSTKEADAGLSPPTQPILPMSGKDALDEIPNRVEEVASLMKLSDLELAERLLGKDPLPEVE